jgi:hypothetical protein
MSGLRLQQKSLDWALLSVQRDGDTDVLPVPPEYDCIAANWGDVREHLLKIDITNYVANAPLRSLTPKRRYGYRVSTQLDPLDHLFYTALIYEVASDLERVRVPTSRKLVHSYRWRPSTKGRFFDSKFDWHTFIDESLAAADATTKLVVTTDISDFYQRLYLHRIERIVTLLDRCDKKHHGVALVSLIKQWNNGVSYGLPIGQAASRIIAEAVISDVDELLLTKGVRFQRFNDDYHLFCRSRREAYEQLSLLATVLYELHGLTLQESKTNLLTRADFRRRHAKAEFDVELDELNDDLEGILDELGIDTWYELPDVDDLEDDVLDRVRALNLQRMLSSALRLAEPDTRTVRWITNRLAQLRDPSSVDRLVSNLPKITHLIPEVARYALAVAEKLDDQERQSIGEKLMDHVASGVGAYLPFHRAWILYVLRSNAAVTDPSRIVHIAERFDDDLTRREAMFALGTCGKDSWFRAKKFASSTMGAWQRRAFLLGASCLPEDERKAFYKARRRGADVVSESIMKGK